MLVRLGYNLTISTCLLESPVRAVLAHMQPYQLYIKWRITGLLKIFTIIHILLSCFEKRL